MKRKTDTYESEEPTSTMCDACGGKLRFLGKKVRSFLVSYSDVFVLLLNQVYVHIDVAYDKLVAGLYPGLRGGVESSSLANTKLAPLFINLFFLMILY